MTATTAAVPRRATTVLCDVCSEPYDLSRNDHACAYRVPEWVWSLSPREWVICGQPIAEGLCQQQPSAHVHTAKCRNGHLERHHDWLPYPGSLVERAAEGSA